MADKEIILRNTQRRPIGFCVAGKEVILAPGERMTVPDTWMHSMELQRFAGAGFVTSKSAKPEKDDKRVKLDDVKEKARKAKPKHKDED